MKGFLKRTVGAFALLGVLMLSASAAALTAPATEKSLRPVVVAPPDQSADEQLAVLAVSREIDPDCDLLLIAADVMKVQRENGRIRMFAYVASADYRRQEDGTFHCKSASVLPYEIYGREHPETGAMETYRGVSFPERKLAPDIWRDFGITEERYDPSLYLKHDIREKADQPDEIIAYLDRDKNFPTDVWTSLVDPASGEIPDTWRAKTETRCRTQFDRYNAAHGNVLDTIF